MLALSSSSCDTVASLAAHSGHLGEHFRGHVAVAGRRAKGVDLFGERGHHLLPARTFRGRNPGVVEPGRVDAEDGQKALEDFQPTPGVEVAFGVVAVPGVAPGDQHAVGAGDQRLGDEKRVDTARTRDADDPQVGGLGKPSNACRVRAAVGTPVAQKADDSQFLPGQDWHKALTSARIWLSVKWDSWMAP